MSSPTRSDKNGYRDVLRISLPLVGSFLSQSLMLFTDRIFLSRYSLDCISAALPAGAASFNIIALFMGLVTYANTFIAQYTGAGQTDKVGKIIWQATWLALASSALMLLAIPFSTPLFQLANHGPSVTKLEIRYFDILIWGAVFNMTASAWGCFYSGRGKTWPVMAISLLTALLNIPLDYALIRGVWGFPEWGIAGAATATILSSAFTCVLYAWLIFRKKNSTRFGTRTGMRLDWPLMKRMIRYGFPSGLQLFLDILAFSVFISLVGGMGQEVLAATNIVFSIHLLAFVPVIGMSVGMSTMVGHAMGQQSISLARKATRHGLHISLVYMGFVGLIFLLFPVPLLQLFRPEGMDNEYSSIVKSGTRLLQMLAVFSLADAIALTYSGALKGAGDTNFMLKTTALLGPFGLILPVWLLVYVFHSESVLLSWSVLMIYAFILGVVFLFRFRGEAWTKHRVLGEEGG